MKKSYFKYILSVLMFGLNGIVASNIDLSSYQIVLMRTFLGSCFLVLLFFVTGQKPQFYKHKKDFMFLLISGIAMGCSWMFLYEAYAQVGVSVATLIYYCGPVIVMALSPIIFKEKLTWFKIAGFIAVLIGIFFINDGVKTQSKGGFGVVCGLLSAATYSLMVISNKKSKKIVGMENAAIQLLVSFVTVAAFVGIKSGYSFNIKKGDLVWILLLGLINTGVGCYFYFSSIGYLPVQTVAVCGYIEPLSAVVFSVLLLGEKMLPLQIIGGMLIIGGAFVGEFFGFKSKISNIN